MRTFTDTSGKSWNITITISTIRRVREMTGVDLAQIIKGDLLDRLANDPVLLVDVLFAVCKPQADEASVSLDMLSGRIEGDIVDDAAMALVLAIADFLPSQPRKLVNQLIDAGRSIQNKAFDDLGAKVSALQGAAP